MSPEPDGKSAAEALDIALERRAVSSARRAITIAGSLVASVVGLAGEDLVREEFQIIVRRRDSNTVVMRISAGNGDEAVVMFRRLEADLQRMSVGAFVDEWGKSSR